MSQGKIQKFDLISVRGDKMKITQEEPKLLSFPNLETKRNLSSQDKANGPSFASFLETKSIPSAESKTDFASQTKPFEPLYQAEKNPVEIKSEFAPISSKVDNVEKESDLEETSESKESEEEIVFDDGSDEDSGEMHPFFQRLWNRTESDFKPEAFESSDKERGLEKRPVTNKETSSHLTLFKSNDPTLNYSLPSKEMTPFIEEAKKVFESLKTKDTKKENIEKIIPKTEGQTDSNSKQTRDIQSPKLDHLTEKENNAPKLSVLFRSEDKNIIKKEKKDPTLEKPANREESKIDLAPKPEPTNEFQFRNKPSRPSNEIDSKKKTGNVESKAELSPKEKEEDPKTRSLGIKDRQFMHLETKVLPANTEKPKGKEGNAEVPMVVGGFKSNFEDKSSEMGDKGGQRFQNQDSRDHQTNSIGLTNRAEKKKEVASPTKSEFQKNFDDLVKQAKFDIVQNGKSTAEIIMNPREFGRLTLKVSVNGEQVEGRILVDSEEAKILIQNELGRLKENLREGGLQLESLQVDLWNDTAFLSSGNQNNESFQNAKDYQEYLNASKSSFQSRREETLEEESTERVETDSLKTLEIFA